MIPCWLTSRCARGLGVKSAIVGATVGRDVLLALVLPWGRVLGQRLAQM